MKIAIFGTKSEAKYLAEQIEKNSRLEISHFIDNNTVIQGDRIGNKRVLSFRELEELYGKEIDKVIIAMRGIYSRLCAIHQLKTAGIEKIGVFKFSAHDFQKEIEIDTTGNSEYIIWLNELERPVLPYLELNVADACNLNCKGCSHFSNLFDKSEKVDYEQFVKDLAQVAQKAYVIQLRLLGGEPLINQELHKFVKASREILPQADIGVVTNGLLITRQKTELFETMRESKIGFWISKYRPTMEMKVMIEEILQRNKVDYFFERDVIKEFARTLSMEGKSNSELSQEVCIEKGCRFLRQGYLYKCPFEGLVDKFAKKFGYESILREKRGFNIYDKEIDWEERLNQYFVSPVPMCKYCAENGEMFEWMIKTNPEKEDWLVDRVQ